MSSRMNNGRFAKGASGNPAGRPIGTRNHATLLQEQLLGSDGELILKKAVDLAKKGNIHAIKLCLERIIPPARERCIEFEVRASGTPNELPVTVSDVLAAVAEGRISPAEGQALANTISSHFNVLEKYELTRRVEALEERVDEVNQFGRERDEMQMGKYDHPKAD